jgi:hypothetical protein
MSLCDVGKLSDEMANFGIYFIIYVYVDVCSVKAQAQSPSELFPLRKKELLLQWKKHYFHRQSFLKLFFTEKDLFSFWKNPIIIISWQNNYFHRGTVFIMSKEDIHYVHRGRLCFKLFPWRNSIFNTSSKRQHSSTHGNSSSKRKLLEASPVNNIQRLYGF